MKNNYFFLRSVVMTTLLFITTNAFCVTGDFGAWVLKTGHAGMSCDTVRFTEKSITIEFWMCLNSADVEKIAIMGTSGTDTGFLVSVRANSANANALELRLFAKDTQKNTAHFYIPRNYFVGKWVHIAYVISAANEKAYAYINGELFAEKAAVGGYYGNSTTPLGIGQWWSDPKPDGKLAEIRIWNVARTAEEIKMNYNKRLKGDEQGLYIYYNFDIFAQIIPNVVNYETNNGSLKPSATWNTVHGYEILSPLPVNLVVANNTVSWDGTGDNYIIQISDKGTGNIIKTDTVQTNSYPLSLLNLSTGIEYTIKVRTQKSFFCSDWASTILRTPSAVVNPAVSKLTIYSEDNSVIINSDENQTINIFSYDGRIIRTIDLNVGKTTINGLSKGLYIIDRQKIIIK